MRPMTRSRPAAFVALFALAFASLLPFAASARMLLADGPAEHCHRLNIDSIIDPDPAAPEGPSQPRKHSCPFCASAVVAPPSSPPSLPEFVRVGAGVDLVGSPSPDLHVRELTLPPSRGPPSP